MENNTNIWEEKSYIEPKKNCLQCSEPDQNDSTTIIEKKLKKEISKDTLKISQWKRNCPKCNKILIHINKAHRNHARKINKLCRKCSSNSEECKKKHRINYLKRLEENGGVQPFYNINACEVIDEYGKQNGYNFQHGLNGGEVSFIGYFVDGYDKEKNVVFEYDEPPHYNSLNELKDKDIKRMANIKKHLNCKFIRYNEKLNEIREY